MKQKLRIYISVPVSGQEREARQKADAIMTKLSKEGHIPVNPLNIYAEHNPTYEDHICYDLRAMLGCDAILFCKGWEGSCGCSIEHDVAMRFKSHGKKDFKIMYEE
ncbi:MAG: DUF4406 domain-containing protein [Muribaculaceae bacterium]|nr:DUF4406 domain-containing protein [Muribaculaceae bacterium]